MTTQQIISPEDMQGYISLIDDLRRENKIPQNGEWTYVVQVMTFTKTAGVFDHYASYLYYDGPMRSKASGAEPEYRKIIYVDKDWGDEHIFDDLGELFDHLRAKMKTFRRHPYDRKGKAFIARDPSTMVLR